MPAVKEPVNLVIEDNKRPDGTTLLPWARGKPLAWDVTVPDTYAESHIKDTMTSPGLAADQAAQQKMDKYSTLLSTHIFCPVAVETAGTWNDLNWFKRLAEAPQPSLKLPEKQHFCFNACPWPFKQSVHRMSCRCLIFMLTGVQVGNKLETHITFWENVVPA